MLVSKYTWLRFLLLGPIALIPITIFALYFTGLNRWGIRNSWLKYPWALLVGLPMAITNSIWNIIFATFIFWSLPPLRNASGDISLFFTTRIKSYLASGTNKDLALVFATIVNYWDKDHFKL